MSTSINDEILRATGGPTINEGLLTWYQTNGALSDDLQDAELEFLVNQGQAPRDLQDMWFLFLGGLGHTGALDDRRYQYWSAQ